MDSLRHDGHCTQGRNNESPTTSVSCGGRSNFVGTWACGDETIPGPTVVKTDTLRLTVHDTVHDTVTVTHYDTVHIQSTVLDTVFLDTFPSPTIMMENFRVGQRLGMSVDFLESGPSIVDTL